ncbi:hypothetical protein LLG50_09615 [Lactococcus lactis subsp. lactis]|nr:hypothetical protein LLG50_09615 [Lactococcus lactis subsp. lactis]
MANKFVHNNKLKVLSFLMIELFLHQNMVNKLECNKKKANYFKSCLKFDILKMYRNCTRKRYL